MKTVADPAVRASLAARLRTLSADTPRRWGTLTPHEMLCHLGDAAGMVLRTRPRVKPATLPRLPIVKWVGLWTALRFPHGIATNPEHNPREKGTAPIDFERDRQRLLEHIDALGTSNGEGLERGHGIFGVMSLRDWQRWMYKHVDHHLRQFGC